MQYCSWQHWTLLPPLDTSAPVLLKQGVCYGQLSPALSGKIERCFCFGPATSSFLKLLGFAFVSSPVAHRTSSDLGAYLPVLYLFAFSYPSWGSSSENTGVVCLSLLWWTTFCHSFLLWPIVSGGPPCTSWLLASLSYANPFTMMRLWSMKG